MKQPLKKHILMQQRKTEELFSTIVKHFER